MGKLYSAHYMNRDIREVVKACIAGKGNAQKALYDRFAPAMLGVLMRYFRDKSQAEDILQEGFLKVFQNVHKLKDYELVGAWMRRIMVNEALQFLRSGKRHFQFDEIENLTYLSTDEDIISELSAREILSLLENLPEGYRIVFNLYAVEGYSHKEIADKLGISESTSKTQYFRAKRAMREQLDEVFDLKKVV